MSDIQAIDTRVAQTTLENALRDAVLLALGKRLPPVASVALLRLVPTQLATGSYYDDDVLVPVVVSNAVTAQYRWSSISTAADDGANVVKPADVVANGRWILWTSPLRFSRTVGGAAAFLHQLQDGYLRRVIILDKEQSEEELEALILGQVPAAVLAAKGDDPVDMTLDGGSRWSTVYRFEVSVISQNLRDRREAAQGSSLTIDADDPGANALDGFVKAVLCGTQMQAVVPGIREVKVGPGENWISEGGQRRVIRSREFRVYATEEFPNAPGDYGEVDEVGVQAHLEQPDAAGDPIDTNNMITAGMGVPLGNSLTQSVAAGTAVVGGVVVSYAGESHTFSPYTDTYRDLLPNGTMVFVPVTEGGVAPPVTATALRVGFTKTFASAVVGDRLLAATSQNYGPRWLIQL